MSGPATGLRRRIERLPAESRQRLARELAGTRPDRLMAWVVPASPDRGAPEPATLDAFLRDRLPDWMVPAGIVILEAIPRLPNGKVDLNALPEPVATRSEDGDFIAPHDGVEAVLAGIWTSVLGIDRVGANDNFFELGGDSILSIQVVARARRAGISLKPDDIFEYQTLARLAAAAGRPAPAPVEAGSVAGPVPLTPIQYWFFEQPLPESHHWHQVVFLEVRPEAVTGGADGAADLGTPGIASVLEEALHAVTSRHDALRLRYAHGPSGWEQTLAEPSARVVLERVTARASSAGHAAAGASAAPHRTLMAAAHELAAGTDLEHGLPVRAALVERDAGRPPVLVLAIHHLVVDPISWGILLEDLDAAFSHLLRGRYEDSLEPVAESGVLPASTTSFAAWSRALRRHALTERARAQSAFWLDSRADTAHIPVDRDGAFTESAAEIISVSLTADETRLLLDSNGAYNTRTDDLLLAALAQAVSGWVGGMRLLVGVEHHGRQMVEAGIDLSRSVGWFTSFFPVVLDLTGLDGPEAVLKSVKEQLRRIEAGGIGYGLLRYLAPSGVSERLRSLPQPALIFNFAGRADMPTDDAAALRPLASLQASRAGNNGRGHLLEINAFLLDSRLRIEWGFSRDLHERGTIERLAATHVEALRALVTHCVTADTAGYTPSDFPEAGLDQDALDRFLEGLES